MMDIHSSVWKVTTKHSKLKGERQIYPEYDVYETYYESNLFIGFSPIDVTKAAFKFYTGQEIPRYGGGEGNILEIVNVVNLGEIHQTFPDNE
jgi:hypothetical protein